jgi:hypothetical protein
MCIRSGESPASELCQENAPALLRRRAGAKGGLSNQPRRRYSFRLLDKRQTWLPVPKIGTGRSTLGLASTREVEVGSAALAPLVQHFAEQLL